MTETLQEFCNSRGVQVRVDRDCGVIHGVKILGLKSRNGRTYLPEALGRATTLYENAKVNVNHPKGSPTQPRDYQDRIGVIRNVTLRRGEGLFADLHFNPKHVLAEQLAWDAANSPQNVGFSHNVQAKTARRGDSLVVEDIIGVQSVDLVADPATTDGLFEQQGDKNATAADNNQADVDPQVKAVLDELTIEQLKRHRPDLVEALSEQLRSEVAELRAKLDELTAQEAMRQKRQTARRLLQEFQLPDPDTTQADEAAIVGPRFIESLLAAADEQAMQELVEERAALVRNIGGKEHRMTTGGCPVTSREQHAVEVPQGVDAKAFVEAIT